MSIFTEAEIAYLNSLRIGRVATAGPDGMLHVVPLQFRYDAELDVIDLLGRGMGTSKKYRDAARNPNIAFVVDDLTEDRKPRGLEVRGVAEAIESGGGEIVPGVDPQFIRLKPIYIATWGVDGDPFQPKGRAVGRR